MARVLLSVSVLSVLPLFSAFGSMIVYGPGPPDEPYYGDPPLDGISPALEDLYKRTVVETRLLPNRLDEDSGYWVYNQAQGMVSSPLDWPHFSFRMPPGGVRTKEHAGALHKALEEFWGTPLPQEDIALLLDAYDGALKADPVDWAAIRVVLAICRTKKQTQCLPELLPRLTKTIKLPKVGARAGEQEVMVYEECLVALGMQRNAAALAVLDDIMAPDFYAGPINLSPRLENGYSASPTICDVTSMRWFIVSIVRRFYPEEATAFLAKWSAFYEARLGDEEVAKTLSSQDQAYEQDLLEKLQRILTRLREVESKPKDWRDRPALGSLTVVARQCAASYDVWRVLG